LTAFVVDASLAGAWLLPDEAGEVSAMLARRALAEGATAPPLFHQEVCNLLLVARRRGRLDDATFWRQLARVERLPVRISPAAAVTRCAELAIARGLTVYDAAYLALALAERLPLATLDRRLREAADAEGIALLPDGK
jgi:predicted nucleic acid-binding protein